MFKTDSYRLFPGLKVFLLSAVLFSYSICYAQHSVITGKVTDKADGKPVPFANVYFNNSQNGTTSNTSGLYMLKNLDAGVYVFIVSFVGYEAYRKTIRLGINDTIRINVKLAPSLTQLAEVEVKGKVDAQWRRQFRKFESNFFGPDVSSKSCEILNPGALVFNENPKTDSFTAESKVPLEIINHRLGYRIYFTLKQFCIYKGSLSIYYGDVRFERLPAETSEQLSTWEMNRYNAYRGSLRNFFRDFINNTLEKDGFKAYLVKPSISYMRTNYFSEKLGKELVPLDRKNMILLSSNPNMRYIVSSLPIEIIYTGRFWPKSPYPDMPFETSRIVFKTGRLEVNANGFVYDPTAFSVAGNRAGERAADMLPFEYKPPGEGGSGTSANLDEIYLHLLDSLSSAINGKGKLSNQEEVVFNTDKPYYIAGDEIWYNSRLVDGFSRQPEEGDRIVYVDLLSPEDSVIAHQTLPCLDGLASGRIALPDYLPDGCYILRGYTDWMRNYSNTGYNGKTILIHSGINNPAGEEAKAALKDTVIMSFYPEGGTLLNSTYTVLAYHATGGDGEGLLVKGTLNDDRGREIGKIETNAMGIGETGFEPDKDLKYYAHVTSVNMRNKDLQYSLPDVKESGYNMKVIKREQGTFTVQVNTTRDLKDHGLILIAQSGGRVFYRRAFFLDGTEKAITMYKSRFPEGVLQLNLFDMEGIYIGQRLLYIDRMGQMPVVSVKTSKPEYNPDESVALQVNLKDLENNPVNAWVSVSLTANDLFQTSAYADQAPEIMLQSEFYEGIQDPEYYFRDTSWETDDELDNLMLTLTKYRYDWRRMKKMDDFKYKKTGSLAVSGTVYDNRKYCRGCKVDLFPVTTGLNYVTFTTDEDGRFKTSVPGLFDSASYVIEATNQNGRKFDAKIVLDDEAPFRFGNPYRNCPVNVKSEAVEDYDSILTMLKKEEEYMNTILLKEVSITKKAIVNPDENDKAKLSGLYSQPDNVIDLRKSGQNYTTVSQALMQNLTGFLVSYDPTWGNHHFTLHGPGYFSSDSANADPIYIVDGMELGESTGFSEINTINPADIDHIEVYKDASAAFWGSRGANGVIAIFTKAYMGTDRGGKPGKRSVLKITGFTPEETFKILGQDSTGIEPDKRITVYWSGNLHTDAAGNVNLNFINASNASYFTVHVEGITSEGVPFTYVERTNR